MSVVWTGGRRAPAPPDVANVRRLARSASPAKRVTNAERDEFWWIVALLVIVAVIMVCGLLVIGAHVVRHWRGFLELALAASIVVYFLRAHLLQPAVRRRA